MTSSPACSTRPLLSPLPSGRSVARAYVAHPSVALPVRTRRLSYQAVAPQKRSAIDHATPPRGAEPPAKKAPRRAPSLPATPDRALLATHDVILVATVSRTAAAGAFAPFSRGRNVNVRVSLDDASAPTDGPTVARAPAQTKAAVASRAGVSADFG